MTTIAILALVGILLFLAELVLPGGIVGVIGGICLLIAIVLTFMEFGATAGAIALMATLFFGIIMFALWSKFFHCLPFTRQLVLKKAIQDPTHHQRLEDLIGRRGITLTKMTPSGQADFGGDKIDVITESGVIEKGRNVEIVATRGPSILVEEVGGA